MQIFETGLPDVKLLRPRLHGDQRGWFAETYNSVTFRELGLPTDWAQDNQSFSAQGVLRGLHYQLQKPQGKLIRVLSGHIWDVAVDMRRNSSSFGRWAGFHLAPRTVEGDLEMLWIPAGFAHGFLVISESAEVLYKTTEGYFPAGERCVRWDDPTLAIDWPTNGLTVSVSAKDAAGVAFTQAETF